MDATATSRSGFTLIELSIVLVIIGLIIGGVLVGQDLIKAAEVRAQISQLEKFSTAVYTFRSKYSGLPGDLDYTHAASFGFVSRSGAAGSGNGDNQIESGHSGGDNLCGEIVMFWNDLSTANLIEGNFVGQDGDSVSVNCMTAANVGVVKTMIPSAKMGRDALITVYTDNGISYYQIISGVTSIDATGHLVGFVGTSPTLTLSPQEAYSIDSKADDGKPLGGRITARDSNFYYDTVTVRPCVWSTSCLPGTATPAAPAVGTCVSNASGNPYNINASTGGNSLACSIRAPI